MLQVWQCRMKKKGDSVPLRTTDWQTQKFREGECCEEERNASHAYTYTYTHTYIYINKVLYSNYCVCMHTYAQLIIRYMYACVIWIAVSLCFIVFRYFHALQHCGKIKPLRLARDQTLSDTDLAPTGVMVQKKQGQVNGMGEGWFGIQRGIECDYIYINWDMAIASIFHYETKLAGLVLTVWLSSIVSK